MEERNDDLNQAENMSNQPDTAGASGTQAGNDDQEGGLLNRVQPTVGVNNTGTREDFTNPLNSGGEPTIDTENKGAVAQTRSPSQSRSGLGSKTFITGSDGDGQI